MNRGPYGLPDVLTRQLLTAALVALVPMAVISPVLGRLLARRALRPLRLITAATPSPHSSAGRANQVGGRGRAIAGLACGAAAIVAGAALWLAGV